MKKILIALLLLPLVCFANAEQPTKKHKAITLFKKECRESGLSAQRKKKCLVEEKRNEAQSNFKNFQENNHEGDEAF